MIVTIGNTKGGVGKSTIAFNLAIVRGAWLVDGDRQGTCRMAMAARAGVLPLLQCDHLPEGNDLVDKVQANAHSFGDVVIDAGGRDSSALRAALSVSDLVLVPFQPRSLDVWALQDINALIHEAKAFNLGLRAVAVLSCADSTGTDNKDAVEALADFPELVYLDAPISRRKAFANAAGNGLSVLEATPKDEKAMAELKRLVDAVFMPV